MKIIAIKIIIKAMSNIYLYYLFIYLYNIYNIYIIILKFIYCNEL